MIILSFACWVLHEGRESPVDGAQPGVLRWWLCSSINPPHGGRRVTVLGCSRRVRHQTWKYTMTSSSEASRIRAKLQFKRTHPRLPLLSIPCLTLHLSLSWGKGLDLGGLLPIKETLWGRCVDMGPAQLSLWRMCWHGHGAPFTWNFNSFTQKPEQS